MTHYSKGIKPTKIKNREEGVQSLNFGTNSHLHTLLVCLVLLLISV